MKVTIIIPVYNAEKYIRRCLDSIINQTYLNIEIIIVNDGSTDNSLNIIKKYEKKDNRIKLIDKKNSGVSNSRNIGISKATGKYIMFVDADDWLEPNMIENMLKKIIKENVDIVRCNYYRNYTYKDQIMAEHYNKEMINSTLDRNQILNEFIKEILNGNIPAYMWLLIIKKETIMKAGKFEENLAMMEDTIFYLKLLFVTNNIYIYDKPLYHYYCNFNSASKSKNKLIENFYDLLLVNKLERKILKENRNDNICNLYELNTAHAKMIEDICYELYKCNKKDEIKGICQNENVKEIFHSAKLKRIPLNKRLAVKYLKGKKIKKLYIYYFFMNILAKIKNYVLKRKE